MTPQIQKPAPEFKGTAVVNGQFKDIKLSDYKGKYLVNFLLSIRDSMKSFITVISGAFLLPDGLVSNHLIAFN